MAGIAAREAGKPPQYRRRKKRRELPPLPKRVQVIRNPIPPETPAMRRTRERERARVVPKREPRKRPFFDFKAALKGGIEADKMVLGLSDKGGAPVQIAALALPTRRVGTGLKLGRLALRTVARHPMKTAALATVIGGEATGKFDTKEAAKNLVKQTKELPAAAGPALVTTVGAAGKDVVTLAKDTPAGQLARIARGKRPKLEIPKATYKDVAKPLATDLKYLSTPGPVIVGYDKQGRKLYRSKSGGVTSNVHEARSGILAKAQERPLDYLLWGRGAHLTGGRIVAKAGTRGLLGEPGKRLELPGHVELRTRTGRVHTKRTSGNPIRRREQEHGRQLSTALTGAVESRIGRELPIVGEHSRATRQLAKGARRQEAFERDRVLRPFERAFTGLSGPQKIAVVLHAQGLRPSELTRFIDAQRALAKRGLEQARRDRKPEVAKRLAGERKDHKVLGEYVSQVPDELYDAVKTDPKLMRARAAAKDLVDLSGDLLAQEGVLTPEARALRPLLALRVVRGARFKDVPYKVGIKPGKLTAGERGTVKGLGAIERISGMERKLEKVTRQFEAEKQRTRPRTIEEAQSRLSELEVKHAQFRKAFYDKVIGTQPFTRGDVGRRNLERLAAKKRGSRKVGRETLFERQGQGGTAIPPTLKQEYEAVADAELEKFLTRHPDHPSVQLYKREQEEMQSLRNGLENVQRLRRGEKPVENLTAAEREQAEFDKAFGKEPAPSFLEAAAQARETPPRLPRKVSAETQGELLGRVRQGEFGTPHHQLERLGTVGSYLKGELGREYAQWEKRQRPLAQKVEPVYETRHELTGGPSVEGLAREADDLFHFPHLGKLLREGQIPLARAGSGPPAKPGIAKLNEGVRLLTSRWLPTPQAWRDGFLHSIAYAHARARGALAFSLGKKLNADGSANAGWYFVRLKKEAPSRAARERGDLHAQLEQYKRGGGIEDWLDQNLVSQKEAARDRWLAEGDEVRQISRADHREIFGDFKGTNRFIRNAIDRPIDFWRALTLTYRPAWVVNNVVGQTLLYALHHTGARGVSAYASAVMDEIRQGRGKDVPYFPEELRHGGFIMSEGVSSHGVGNLGRVRSAEAKLRDRIQAFNAAASDAIPRRAAWYRLTEGSRSLMNKVYRTSYTHDQFLDMLERSARPDAPDSELRRLHDDLVQQVFDELVDFRNLSEAERKIVRRVIPFYSWIKGISLSTARLGLNHPLRAEMLAMLGQQGVNRSDRAFGEAGKILRNVLPLGKEVDRGRGGERDVLSTVGLNPLQTPADVVRHASALVTRGETGDNPFLMANPIFQTGVEAITRRQLYSQRPLSSRFGQLGIGVTRGAEAFPEFATARKILFPESKVKGSGEPRPTVPGTKYFGVPSEALRFVGVPAKRINVPAHEQIVAKQRLASMSAPERELEQVRSFQQQLVQLAKDNDLPEMFASKGKLEPNTREAIMWLGRRNVARAKAREDKGSRLTAIEKLDSDLKVAVQYNLLSDGDRSTILSNARKNESNIGKMTEALGTYYFKRPALTYWRARLKALGKDVDVPSLYGG